MYNISFFGILLMIDVKRFQLLFDAECERFPKSRGPGRRKRLPSTQGEQEPGRRKRLPSTQGEQEPGRRKRPHPSSTQPPSLHLGYQAFFDWWHAWFSDGRDESAPTRA